MFSSMSKEEKPLREQLEEAKRDLEINYKKSLKRTYLLVISAVVFFLVFLLIVLFELI